MSTAFGYRPSFTSPFFPPSRGHNIAADTMRKIAWREEQTRLRQKAEAEHERAWREARMELRRRNLVARALRGHELEKAQKVMVVRSMAEIVAEVVAKHHITGAQIMGEGRARNVVTARHEAFWLCTQFTGCSLQQIGRFFGNRDHTTVLHGVRRHAARIAGEGKP